MDTSPIAGYITRKQAADRCQRAERTLQRYWSKAIELADQKVLMHLKLRSEDGEIVDGPAVTKERIDELRAGGKNPTWYAEADWAVETYGPRTVESQAGAGAADDSSAPPPEKGNDDRLNPALEALRSEIAELRRDKDRLYTELTIKNDQIKEANDRTRESNTLMRELQKMLGNWQDQAFRTLPARTVSGASELPATEAVVDVGQGSSAHAKQSTSKSRKPAGKKRTPTPAPGKPKWYHVPTFKRIFTRSS